VCFHKDQKVGHERINENRDSRIRLLRDVAGYKSRMTNHKRNKGIIKELGITYKYYSEKNYLKK
jgi:hypothetical protein